MRIFALLFWVTAANKDEAAADPVIVDSIFATLENDDDFGVLSFEEFLEKAGELFDSPMKSSFSVAFRPEFFDERIAMTFQEIDRLCEAPDASVDRAIVGGIREELRQHIELVYKDLQRDCIEYHKKKSVGQL